MSSGRGAEGEGLLSKGFCCVAGYYDVRFYAGLSVSRAFGDMAARPYGLISEPDFVQIEIPEIKAPHRPMKKSQPHFPLMLIVASDGLWDTISPYEILDFVSNAQQPQDKLFESLRQIAEVAWRRRLAAEGRSDDTTAIVALLQ